MRDREKKKKVQEKKKEERKKIKIKIRPSQFQTAITFDGKLRLRRATRP
jgi:hypothetical protein